MWVCCVSQVGRTAVKADCSVYPRTNPLQIIHCTTSISPRRHQEGMLNGDMIRHMHRQSVSTLLTLHSRRNRGPCRHISSHSISQHLRSCASYQCPARSASISVRYQFVGVINPQEGYSRSLVNRPKSVLGALLIQYGAGSHEIAAQTGFEAPSHCMMNSLKCQSPFFVRRLAADIHGLAAAFGYDCRETKHRETYPGR